MCARGLQKRERDVTRTRPLIKRRTLRIQFQYALSIMHGAARVSGRWQGGGGKRGADIKVPLVQDAALSAAPRSPGGGLTPARHAYTQLTHNLDARLREWTSPRPESIPQIQDYITNRETLGLRNAPCLSWKFSATRMCAVHISSLRVLFVYSNSQTYFSHRWLKSSKYLTVCHLIWNIMFFFLYTACPEDQIYYKIRQFIAAFLFCAII